MCENLRSFEKPRVELMHSAINSFVVFEMSAEMNNKYDVGNFAKLLETFDRDKELQLIDNFLKGDAKTGIVGFIPDIKMPKFDFVEFEAESPIYDFRKLT